MISTRLAIAALVTVELALSTSGAMAAQRTHHHHASPGAVVEQEVWGAERICCGPG